MFVMKGHLNEAVSLPAWPSSAVNSMNVLDRLVLQNRGAVYEGDVFSILQASPFIVRSFEFAQADGAIDCSNQFSPETNFADRFWETDQRLRLVPSSTELLLFDVKSKVSQYAGDQIYSTSIGQRRHVAFYIGICAADPSFVEIFPNYHQQRSLVPKPFQNDPAWPDSHVPPTSAPTSPVSLSSARTEALSTVPVSSLESDRRHVAVNSSRISKLPPSAYILDPCGSPYRLPIGYLCEAIHRVRQCVQVGDTYVNPWTKVPFPAWKPVTTRSADSLKPSESSEHFTAYKAIMEIYRFVGTQDIKLDFIGLQPRLADFKLITKPSNLTQSNTNHYWPQIFIQHKLDTRDRALRTPLEKVAIARTQETSCRWYFTCDDRFVYYYRDRCFC